MLRIRLLVLASVLVPFTLAACGGNKLAPASVSGSLSYKGQPIKTGTMAFHTAEGTAYPAQIGSDGTYSITDIPEGDLVVTVDTESSNPDRKGAPKGKDADRRAKVAQQPPPDGAAPPPPSAHYIKIPSKYANAKTSTVTVTVKRGRQVHNIDLTD